ncbi:hypothetical protein FQA39_LY10967 [Lamprigera yunnana]|nr:hypothetical protein FQA39_LY10967 [Lamprigera yunnana]
MLKDMNLIENSLRKLENVVQRISMDEENKSEFTNATILFINREVNQLEDTVSNLNNDIQDIEMEISDFDNINKNVQLVAIPTETDCDEFDEDDLLNDNVQDIPGMVEVEATDISDSDI